ncbi:MAG: hypothetical protein FRX48_08030 [Lasallia pustulata]|uniref:Uncharacterized protein n=1 Tax=Lasallia pustulata TaxID=136370 RepID=A0A5M8PH28_9LECA|nr:MAG: hypothetical protein FRX48_08030 [Lasallia pustulata]
MSSVMKDPQCPVVEHSLPCLLRIPGETRNQIWSYCLNFTDRAHVTVRVTERNTFAVPEHETEGVEAALLTVNKQIYMEARAILYGENKFHIAIDEGSCIRAISQAQSAGVLSAIPAMWNTRLREHIYMIKRLSILVTLNGERREPPKTLSGEDKENWYLQGKMDNASIVKNALEELRNVFLLSRCLVELEVEFLENGQTDLKTGMEHKVLQPLEGLRRLKDVRVFGDVPLAFASYLEGAVRRRS